MWTNYGHALEYRTLLGYTFRVTGCWCWEVHDNWRLYTGAIFPLISVRIPVILVGVEVVGVQIICSSTQIIIVIHSDKEQASLIRTI